MGKRMVFVIVCVIAVMALVAPAALADLAPTNMSPSYGVAGSSVTCTVEADFWIDSGLLQRALAPSFTLVNGGTTISGTTNSWNASSASVTFALPAGGPQATYDLEITQQHRLIPNPYSTDTGSLADAFDLFVRPTITSLSPPSVTIGSPDLALVVHGNYFVNIGGFPGQHSTVRFNGTSMTTTFNSNTQLTATIPAASLTTAGTAQVTVWNSSGYFPMHIFAGLESAPFSFGITVPTPVITSIDPATAVAGGPAFNLAVVGTGFLTGPAGAVVVFNGTDLATTRDSATHLTAAVPASLITTAGSATITVRNGGAGAPVSNGKALTVGNPAPAMGSINPTSVWAGCVKTDIVLTVTGTNFMNGSRIVLSGGDKANTTFVSATQLTVPLTPADMALPVASLMVSVKNPPFPPGTSSAGGLPLALQPETTNPTVTISGADSAWHRSPVALTFAATDAQSGVQKIQYMAPPGVGAWTDGASYTVPTSSQGSIAVSVQALDWCNKVGTASATVNIDTTKPGTETQGNVTVRKGRTAKLKYSIDEPAGLSPTADVVIKVKRGSGRTAKTITANDVPVGPSQTASFTCKLAKGKYTWYVYATDLAGNTQENIAHAKLTVK
jgi:hypothetical protein